MSRTLARSSATRAVSRSTVAGATAVANVPEPEPDNAESVTADGTNVPEPEPGAISSRVWEQHAPVAPEGSTLRMTRAISRQVEAIRPEARATLAHGGRRRSR